MPESPSQAGPPVPPASAGGEDLLGLRIAAALIDLALLFVLSVVVGVTIGDASVEGGELSFLLSGAALGLLLVLVLLYYFALEAVIGRTVGKLLLGLQAVGRGGGRPSLWAVAVRTVLRVVDWSPGLYLVGFVAMMATGARRQRLGDLAAKTSVARALPIRRRGVAVALLASSLILALAVSIVSVAVSREGANVSREGANTYRAHGVSFEYPAGWQEVTGDLTDAVKGGGADELWTAAVGVGDVDIVKVTAYRLNMPITAQNLDAATEDVTSLIRGLFEQAGGAMQDGPEEITVAGMPGLRYLGDSTNEDGTQIESSLVLVFDGTTEYFIGCQHSQDQAAEIERGCDQIVRTFEVENESGDEVATYESYMQVADDQGVVTVEVPVEWDDLDGREDPEYGPSIHAAPDLERFRQTWDVPGIMVEVSSRFGPDDISAIMNQGPSGQCTSEGREPYQDPLYAGEIERWTGCGGTDTAMVVAAVAPDDGGFLVRVFGKAVDDRDLDAIDRVLDTLEISQLGAAESEPTTTDEDWLEKISTLRAEIDDAIDDAIVKTDSELTSAVLTEIATAMRACSHEVASIGPPSARLQRVHALVKKACQKYDKGAECLFTAADIGSPVVGAAKERRLSEALDCGFAGLNRGSELLIAAETEVEFLQTSPG